MTTDYPGAGCEWFRLRSLILIQDVVSTLNRRNQFVISLLEQDPDAWQQMCVPDVGEAVCEGLNLNVYVSGVLDSGRADFDDGEEVYDAIGGVLQEVSTDSKNEDDVRDICLQMFNTLKL